MPGVALKIQRFFGEAPKISSELLPDTVAQYAYNLDLWSGDLQPYRRPERLFDLDKPGTAQSIYPMRDPLTNDIKWLHWTTDVDVAAAQVEGDVDQRVYFTGDGAPKATNYTLATSGAQFPTQSYTLGLPLPTAKPAVTAVAFTQKSATKRARDAGNTVTITTSAAHGLTTGAYVTTTSFGGTGYNLSNVRVTVISDTKFSYFSFGNAEAETTDTAGRVDLAGTTQPRTYVYTYFTDWQEESVPSEPSDTVFVKEGQTVNVTALPSLWTHGAGYQEAGMKLRLYRTVTGVNGTLYFRCAELDFPTPVAATYSRTGSTVTVTKASHGFTTGAVITFRATTGTASSGVYTITVVNTSTFTFSDAVTGTTSGDCEYAAALSFADDTDVTELDNVLESEEYDPPEPTMQGLMAIHNGMFVGFFGNTICFSEPNKPHAWPISYRLQVDSPIVGLGAYGTTLLALTEKTPWKLDGNNPSAMSLTRTDYILPCVSKRSIINIGFGVVWASAGGLAVYSTTIGTDYLTKNVHSWVTWSRAVNPQALYGAYYRGRYFGSDGTNTFLFERNEQVGGHLVQSDVKFTAAYYDAKEDKFYFADSGGVWLWNSQNIGNAVLDWKSKTFTTKQPINIGAARVVADYLADDDAESLEQENARILAENQALIDADDPAGALCTADAGAHQVAGSNLQDFSESYRSVTFQFFVDKKLVYTATRLTSDPFRLPAGYRADTFEVRVATNVRVRAIHLAESMVGLRGT
ncbi:MAG: hypothetical protein ACKOW0_00770 [Schleiferiaceae bacterium]